MKALSSERVTNICIGEANCIVLTQSNRVYAWGRGTSSNLDAQCEVVSYLPSSLSKVETANQYIVEEEASDLNKPLEPILSISNEDEFGNSKNLNHRSSYALSNNVRSNPLNNTMKLDKVLREMRGVHVNIDDSSREEESSRMDLLEGLEIKDLKPDYSKLIQESAEEFLSLHSH